MPLNFDRICRLAVEAEDLPPISAAQAETMARLLNATRPRRTRALDGAPDHVTVGDEPTP